MHTGAVNQPSQARHGRLMVGKGRQTACLGLIGSCACQTCTCGTYFSPEVSLAVGGRCVLGVRSLSGHPSRSYFRILSVIDSAQISNYYSGS